MKKRQMYLVQREHNLNGNVTEENVCIYETAAAALNFIKKEMERLYEAYGNSWEATRKKITCNGSNTYVLTIISDTHFLQIRVYYSPIDVYLED